MAGKVIGKEMSMGYPGSYARTPDCIIVNRVAATDVEFGLAVVLKPDNTYAAFGGSDTAATFGGVAVREVKQATNFVDQNNVKYLQGDQMDALERGNIVVKCQRGTPTAGGKVYVRKTANSTYPDAVVGGFEAAADSTNTVELTNAYWTTGHKGAGDVAEISIKFKA